MFWFAVRLAVFDIAGAARVPRCGLGLDTLGDREATLLLIMGPDTVTALISYPCGTQHDLLTEKDNDVYGDELLQFMCVSR